MAIAILNSGSANKGSSGTSYTYSYNSGTTGSDRYLLVSFVEQSGGTVTGVTYAGVSMTKLVGPTLFGSTSGNNAEYIYGLLNPTTSSNNVVITCSSSAANYFTQNWVITGTSGVLNTSHTTVGTTTSSSVSDSVTTTVDGCGVFCFAGNDINANAFFFLFKFIDNGGNAIARTTTFPQTTAGSASFTWTFSGSSGNNASQVVALEPVSTPSGPANLKSLDSNLKANIKSYNSNLIANIKSIDSNV